MNANISNSPVPVKLSDGKTYFISPLTDRDMFSIDHFVRQKFQSDAIEGIPKNCTEKERAMYVKIAMKEARKITITAPAEFELDENGERKTDENGEFITIPSVADSIMETVEGWAFLLWISMSKSNPKLTLENVLELILNHENLEKLKNALELSQTSREDETEDKKNLPYNQRR